MSDSHLNMISMLSFLLLKVETLPGLEVCDRALL